MEKCLKCKCEKELVERSDYCHECYAVLKKHFDAAYDRVEKKEKRGGNRPGAGRPPIGETKVIKLTLPVDGWEWIEESVSNGHAASKSEFMRDIIEFARTGLK